MPTKLIAMTAVVACTVVFVSRDASATTITFDATITSPSAPNVNGTFVAEYHTPVIPPVGLATTLETQGYRFGGYGLLPPSPPQNPTGATQPELDLMLDSSLCPIVTGNPLNTCASSGGTHYLFADEPFALITAAANPTFSFVSFQASGMFGNGMCLNCDGGDLLSAVKIRVTGFRQGVFGAIATQTFLLTPGFLTYIVSDPAWQNTTKVVFEGLDANNNVTGGIVAIDNINVNAAVPEPASFVLLGTALAALGLARRRLMS